MNMASPPASAHARSRKGTARKSLAVSSEDLVEARKSVKLGRAMGWVGTIRWGLASCNHGSESGGPAPLVAIAFPPATSRIDGSEVIVTGTASDPHGVAEVRVNGVLAATSD